MLYFHKALFTLLWEESSRFLAKPLRLGWGSEDNLFFESPCLLFKDGERQAVLFRNLVALQGDET